MSRVLERLDRSIELWLPCLESLQFGFACIDAQAV
jgi:hypothetical protein